MPTNRYANCGNCGAPYGLHHFENLRCPYGGSEETREGYEQRWGNTTFINADEEINKELLEALKKSYGTMSFWKKVGCNIDIDALESAEKAIKHAEGLK